jgi:hypothetical protein
MAAQWPFPLPSATTVQDSDCDLAETEISNPIASTAIQPGNANIDLFIFIFSYD